MHYTFQASGSLWQDALVMQDLQTKSLWSQISGECIQGPMEGKKLTILPASHTNFSQFSKDYPSGLLLKKPEKGEQSSHYEKYFADSKDMQCAKEFLKKEIQRTIHDAILRFYKDIFIIIYEYL